MKDEDDLLSVGLAEQAREEVDQHRCGEARLEDTELQAALVRDRRDHVRTETLAAALNERRLPDRSPNGDVRRCGRSASPSRRPTAAAPARGRRAAPTPGSAPPASARPTPGSAPARAAPASAAEPPHTQIPPRRLLRHPHTEAPLDQLAHQRPRPQKPRQAQLIGIPVPDRLSRSASAAAASAPSSPPAAGHACAPPAPARPPRRCAATHSFTDWRLTSSSRATSPVAADRVASGEFEPGRAGRRRPGKRAALDGGGSAGAGVVVPRLRAAEAVGVARIQFVTIRNGTAFRRRRFFRATSTSWERSSRR